MSKPTPPPWTFQHSPGSAETTYCQVVDQRGRNLFDTANSDVMEIETIYDEDGSASYDVQGQADLTLAAAAHELLEACRLSHAFIQYGVTPELCTALGLAQNAYPLAVTMHINERLLAAISKAGAKP